MKASKIREMTNQELHNELKKLKNELFNLRFQLATNQVKRTIARIKTILRERELEQEKANKNAK